MLGSLEPMCSGEEVDERVTTIEECTEREGIYKHHLVSQAVLTSVTVSAMTAVNAAAAAVAETGVVHVVPDFDVLAHFLAE